MTDYKSATGEKRAIYEASDACVLDFLPFFVLFVPLWFIKIAL